MRPAIGVTVWVFDINRRVYRNGVSAPIYREHFAPYQIVAETAFSWILDDGTKIGKITRESKSDHRGYRKRILSAEDVDDACFIHDERYRIAKAVHDCYDVDVLRRIDALLRAIGEPPSAAAVDPHADSTGTLSTREKGIA